MSDSLESSDISQSSSNVLSLDSDISESTTNGFSENDIDYRNNLQRKGEKIDNTNYWKVAALLMGIMLLIAVILIILLVVILLFVLVSLKKGEEVENFKHHNLYNFVHTDEKVEVYSGVISVPDVIEAPFLNVESMDGTSQAMMIFGKKENRIKNQFDKLYELKKNIYCCPEIPFSGRRTNYEDCRQVVHDATFNYPGNNPQEIDQYIRNKNDNQHFCNSIVGNTDIFGNPVAEEEITSVEEVVDAYECTGRCRAATLEQFIAINPSAYQISFNTIVGMWNDWGKDNLEFFPNGPPTQEDAREYIQMEYDKRSPLCKKRTIYAKESVKKVENMEEAKKNFLGDVLAPFCKEFGYLPHPGGEEFFDHLCLSFIEDVECWKYTGEYNPFGDEWYEEQPEGYEGPRKGKPYVDWNEAVKEIEEKEKEEGIEDEEQENWLIKQ